MLWIMLCYTLQSMGCTNHTFPVYKNMECSNTPEINCDIHASVTQTVFLSPDPPRATAKAAKQQKKAPPPPSEEISKEESSSEDEEEAM